MQECHKTDILRDCRYKTSCCLFNISSSAKYFKRSLSHHQLWGVLCFCCYYYHYSTTYNHYYYHCYLALKLAFVTKYYFYYHHYYCYHHHWSVDLSSAVRLQYLLLGHPLYWGHFLKATKCE